MRPPTDRGALALGAYVYAVLAFIIVPLVIVIPMSGWLSAYFGRKRYLTGSIILFVLASFFCGAATSLGGLVFWRVVQGIGGGALLSTAQATLFEAFPPKEVGIGQAMFGVGVMVGPTLGPTLGGWIVDHVTWRWIFLINPFLAVVAIWIAWRHVPESFAKESDGGLDWAGALLALGGLGGVAFGLIASSDLGWDSPAVIAALAIGLVLLAVLIRVERYAANPAYAVLDRRETDCPRALTAVTG